MSVQRRIPPIALSAVIVLLFAIVYANHVKHATTLDTELYLFAVFAIMFGWSSFKVAFTDPGSVDATDEQWQTALRETVDQEQNNRVLRLIVGKRSTTANIRLPNCPVTIIDE